MKATDLETIKQLMKEKFEMESISTRVRDGERPLVVLLGTGGTIAGAGAKGKVAGYVPGGVNLDDLCDSVYGLEDLADIVGMEICKTDSNNVADKEWLRMASVINILAKLPYVSGFVITHGTNTIEETAYFLHLTVHTEKPVILTGSMRPSTALSPDGPMNLYQAVSLASREEGKGMGVMVVFADAIYSARDVQKVSTFKTDAFHSRDFGCLGYMKEEIPYFFQKPLKKHTYVSEFSTEGITTLPKVSIAYFHSGADPEILDYMADHYAGIVIAGCGIGSYSESWRWKVKDLEEKGIPVVRASRTQNGIIVRHKIIEKTNNVIPANTLSPQKAKILLQLALTQTKDYDAIRTLFLQY